jgi:tetratricopeptide (TPR) repeat protein
MIGPVRLTALAVLLAGMALSMSGCRQLQARDQLNKGVEAYKGAHYEEAVGHFQRATQLDPNLAMAKTYLGTAISQNVVPGLNTVENLKVAQQAIEIFEDELKTNPSDVNSVKQIAGIYFSIKKWEDAKTWQKKVLAIDPKDPEAAYTIGVIDWTIAHENALKVLQAAGVNDDGEGNAKAPKKVMAELANMNKPLVEEGLQYLNQAVANRANYDDAMAYLNLVYRRKADVDFGDAKAVKQDLADAEHFRTLAMDVRKQNEEKKNAGPKGIVMDSSGNLK